MALQLDGVQHIMRGMSQGAAIGNMLRRAALEEEALGRAKARQERETQLEDLSIQDKLLKMGRRVNGNVVMDKVTMPGSGIPMDPRVAEATGVGPRLVEMARRVDPSRVMRANLSDGRSLAVERYTPEEEVEREMQNTIARGRVNTGLKIDETKLMQMIGESPGSLELLRQTGAGQRAGMTAAAADARAADGRRSAAQIAEDTRKFTAAQNDLNRKSRKETAGIRASGAGRITHEQERMRAKDAYAQVDDLQKQHDAADAEEQRLHAEAEASGERLKAIHAELKSLGKNEGDTARRLALGKERGELETKIATNKLLAKGVNYRKRDFLKRKDELRGGAPAGGAAAPKIAVGQTVKLRNGQTVTVKKLNADGTFEY